MKVMAVVGTRPEAIKMAPVVQELQRHSENFEVILCATGQHREMLDQVLELFTIAPDIDLNLMQRNQTLNQVAARVLMAMDPVLAEIKPEWVLVQGDTTTVMATSLAAHHHRIRVGHVEAGLRTYDRANPFPEEMNRVVSDHVSDLHFAPTPRAYANLLAEGISEDKVIITGNTVIDALKWVVARPLSDTSLQVAQNYDLLDYLGEGQRQIMLVTAHRRENHGRPIRQICIALKTLAEMQTGFQIVYPVHRNPNIWEPVHALLGDVPGITLMPPIDYALLAHLMKCSYLILTDSGGIQEEAPSLGVPVLVLREATERPEAVEAGSAKVVGTDPDRIVNEVFTLIHNQEAYEAMAKPVNTYGDGHASSRIAQALLRTSKQGVLEKYVKIA